MVFLKIFISKVSDSTKLMLFVLCVFCQTSFAQDDQTVETTPTSQQADEQVNQQRDNESEVGNTNADDQVFIPSEEISEDAPVAFPVDI